MWCDCVMQIGVLARFRGLPSADAIFSMLIAEMQLSRGGKAVINLCGSYEEKIGGSVEMRGFSRPHVLPPRTRARKHVNKKSIC